MPELPEVETMRRGILGIAGARIRDVINVPNACRPLTITPGWKKFAALQVGQRIMAVERVGKRIVIRLENELRIVIEPRMTGLVLLDDPPSREHLRIEWKLEPAKNNMAANRTSKLTSKQRAPSIRKSKSVSPAIDRFSFWDRRGLGVVRLVDQKEFDRYYGADRVGPDALVIDAETFRERVGRGKRPIKVALLDQTLIAGIGNLYASEILHLAQVDPKTRSDRVKPGQWDVIHQCTIEILERAIQFEGSTLSDRTYRNVLNQNGGYQNHHRVYDREGEMCKTCNRDSIIRIVQAQRSTFFCPECQNGRKKD